MTAPAPILITESGRFDRGAVTARAQEIFRARVAKSWGHAMALAYAEARLQQAEAKQQQARAA